MDENKKKSMQTGLEIAVIGMAGRFPGAGNIDEFWDTIKNGVASITFYAEEELKAAGIGTEVLENPDFVKSGGGILENADCFDASFFGYLPCEAEIMDPQVRIFHECTWEALEDAGYAPYSYSGQIGIYAGAANNPAWEAAVILSGKNLVAGEYTSGSLSNKEFLCTWLSYKLNLKGPAIEIHTACSTSLVAIHIASRALLTKECDIALAGGVCIKSAQKFGYLYQEGTIASLDGYCRTFDAKASGTGSGEGAGVVVLKKLAEAVKDRDHIYALIKGTAVNNDGIRKVGFTAPSIEGQAEVIKTALHISRVEPESIGYIETHGTGTIIGDPIEIEALKLAFNTREKGFCAVGSVKTNIGHLDTAAGVTGFLKAILALKYRLIPPSLHFENPNPKIDFADSPFFVNTGLREWKSNEYPRRAGVSSFGIGGTNAHVVLEEAALEMNRGTADREYRLIILSAKTEPALDIMTGNLAAFLGGDGFNHVKPGDLPINLGDAAYTLQVGREVFQYRRAAVCSQSTEFASIATNPDKISTFHTPQKNKSIVFMFPGQGSQYMMMGWGLYRTEPVFRQEMDSCFEILEEVMKFDIKDILYPTTNKGIHEESDIFRPAIAQPILFMVEYALAKLLMSWGIQPGSMIGHSLGEYTAACLAGVFSLADALKSVVVRSRLMEKIPGGMMLSVSLPEEELRPLMNPEISLSALNSSSLCVISGTIEAVVEFEDRLKEMGCPTRRLHTTHAFHSAMMETILAEFEENMKKIRLHKPGIPFISGVTGHWISTEKATNPEYWARHIRETVNFRDGLSRLLENKDTVFIELGPGNGLSTFLRQHKDKRENHFAVNLIRHFRENIPDDYYLMSKIGQLWLYGVNIEWAGFYPGEQRYRISLPTYPFARSKFSFNAESVVNGAKIGKWILAQPSKSTGSESTEPENTGGAVGPQLNSRSGLTTPYVAPRTETEHKLATIWQNFFGLQTVGIHDHFFELGGDSLKAAVLTARVYKELNVKIPLAEIFATPTINGLAEFIKRVAPSRFVSIKETEKKEYYSLSSSQKRLYILQGMALESTGYNMPTAVTLEGEFDRERFKQTVGKLIKRHESLRTSFAIIKKEPVQRIHDEKEIEIEYYDGFRAEARSGENDAIYPSEFILRDFIRPFDLSEAPLIRIGLIKQGEAKQILMFDMHHIISDGMSMNIVVTDFIALYKGENLPGPRLQYKDFSEWRRIEQQGASLKGQEDFWLTELAGEIPRLNLPYDFERPDISDFGGCSINFAIAREETRQLKKIALEESATLFMVLLAIYSFLLSRVSGQEVVVIGTSAAGRPHIELEKVLGMFVNTLALKITIPRGKSFKEFILRVKEKILNAFANQDYQFDDLVDKLNPPRIKNRNPLFDARFTMQTFDVNAPDIPGLTIRPYEFANNTAKFDLTLSIVENNDTLQGRIEYCSNLFKEEKIRRFIDYYREILSQVLKSREKKMEDMTITLGFTKAPIDIDAIDLDF